MVRHLAASRSASPQASAHRNRISAQVVDQGPIGCGGLDKRVESVALMQFSSTCGLPFNSVPKVHRLERPADRAENCLSTAFAVPFRPVPLLVSHHCLQWSHAMNNRKLIGGLSPNSDICRAAARCRRLLSEDCRQGARSNHSASM